MMGQQIEKIWKTGLYLRLSQEDAREGESGSITTQRSMLIAFARRNNLIIVDEYVDDGYSGTSFDRPGFQRLIRDIELGRVNCIVTKDLSRLGRNAAELMNYMDTWFPAHEVRYLSVTEGYDTLKRNDGSSMSIMSAVHEMYARDISTKINSALAVKMGQGKFISAFAPYGYQKDPENKNHLIIDPIAGAIVQEIYTRAASGEKTSAIATSLNARGVLTPAQYRCANNPKLRIENYSQREEWTSSGITKLLKREVYLGILAQGKTKKLSFKEKTSVTKRREDWFVVPGTHEPLVSEDIFRLANTRCSSRRSLPTKGFTNIFAGIAFCADCGKQMSTTTSRKKGATCNLICGRNKAYGASACSNHTIDYDVLCEAVLATLRPFLTMTQTDKEQLLEKLMHWDEQEQRRRSDGRAARALNQARARKQEVVTVTQTLYEDRARGAIADTMFNILLEKYIAELEQLDSDIATLETAIQAQEQQAEGYRKFFALIEEVGKFDKLTRPILQRLVERIEVEQGQWVRDENGKKIKRQKIYVYLRFIGQAQTMMLAS